MEDEKRNEELFNQVFKNIFLFKLIYRHVKIYKSNEFVCFNSREELLEYPERDYIQSIEYKGENLEINDLPYGLESIEFITPFLSNVETTHLSKLPNTVHTTKGISILTSITPSESYIIPPNITSISFKKCPSISSYTDEEDGIKLVIPNTIKRLSLLYYNSDILLSRGDIPQSVTFLEMYPQMNIFQDENGYGVLPNSLKELRFGYYDDNCKLDLIIPKSVEKLYISHESKNLKEDSGLNACCSIKKLSIDSNGWKIFEPNSLPLSLTSLKITNTLGALKINSIPNGLKKLKIHFMIDHQMNQIEDGSIPNSVESLFLGYAKISQLPTSLTNLKISYFYDGDINQLISILPTSLTSITLPSNYNSNYLKFPSTIKNIKFL